MCGQGVAGSDAGWLCFTSLANPPQPLPSIDLDTDLDLPKVASRLPEGLSLGHVMDAACCDTSLGTPVRGRSEMGQDAENAIQDPLFPCLTQHKRTSRNLTSGVALAPITTLTGPSSSTSPPALPAQNLTSCNVGSLAPIATRTSSSSSSTSPPFLPPQCPTLPRIAACTQPSQPRTPAACQDRTRWNKTPFSPQSDWASSASNANVLMNEFPVLAKPGASIETSGVKRNVLDVLSISSSECRSPSSPKLPIFATIHRLELLPTEPFRPSPPSELSLTHMPSNVPPTADQRVETVEELSSQKLEGSCSAYDANDVDPGHSADAFPAQNNLRQANRRLRKYRSKSDQLRHSTENKCKMLGALCVRRNLLTSDVVTITRLVQASRHQLDKQRVVNKELMKYISLLTELESVNASTGGLQK